MATTVAVAQLAVLSTLTLTHCIAHFIAMAFSQLQQPL